MSPSTVRAFVGLKVPIPTTVSSMSVPPEDEINNLVAAGFPITPAGLIPCGVAITCGVPVFIAACGDA